MRRPLPMLLAFAVLLATSAFAASPTTSPLIGRWSIDVATLPMPPEARPKSVTMEMRDAGDGKWSIDVDIVHPNEERMHAEGTLPLDGTPQAIEGDYWADVATARMPAPNVLVLQLVDDGVPASTRVYSVAGDGQVLTETKAFFGKDGTPILQTNRFTRVAE